jgi:L-asparaginase/Glu-tRNA(Gln) amidotransferase subunit D
MSPQMIHLHVIFTMYCNIHSHVRATQIHLMTKNTYQESPHKHTYNFLRLKLTYHFMKCGNRKKGEQNTVFLPRKTAEDVVVIVNCALSHRLLMSPFMHVEDDSLQRNE